MRQDPALRRQSLVDRATELFRRQGYMATSVDEICAAAGVTKGAFFHYFDSKEQLAETCLAAWNDRTVAMVAAAPWTKVRDPARKALAFLDFMIAAFERPGTVKSCLAGTTVQEVSETHPALRDAAQCCFASLQGFIKRLLDDACRDRRLKLDTESLAALWLSTLQGALVLAKASRDESVIPSSMRHVRRYIGSLIEPRETKTRRRTKR